jgi:hypothetical protein
MPARVKTLDQGGHDPLRAGVSGRRDGQHRRRDHADAKWSIEARDAFPTDALHADPSGLT